MKFKTETMLFGVLFAAVIVLYVLHFTTREKLVYVDSAKLVNGYKGMEVARKEYQRKSITWKANLDTLSGEVQREVAKFQAESPKMTATEKDLNKKLIQSKQQQFVDYQNALKQKAEADNSEMTRKVLDEINAYIKEYGKSNHYRIILAATEYGNIAYAADGLDLTDQVLDGLNQKVQ